MVSLELQARLDNLLSTAQAETADIDLFTPIAEKEECPLCLIPLPLTESEIVFMPCCGKNICIGCTYKQTMNDVEKGVKQYEQKCAFCRQPSNNNYIKLLKKLMKKNVPNAYMQMACLYRDGDEGAMQSYTRALEMLIRVAELDHPPAFGMIGKFYYDGNAVDVDRSKALAFYEIAAKKGDIVTRRLIIVEIWDNHGSKLLIKHLKVIASAGCKGSMDKLMQFYSHWKELLLSKEELTQTLRAYQASSNEMKSKDRDEAIACMFQASSNELKSKDRDDARELRQRQH